MEIVTRCTLTLVAHQGKLNLFPIIKWSKVKNKSKKNYYENTLMLRRQILDTLEPKKLNKKPNMLYTNRGRMKE